MPQLRVRHALPKILWRDLMLLYSKLPASSAESIKALYSNMRVKYSNSMTAILSSLENATTEGSLKINLWRSCLVLRKWLNDSGMSLDMLTERLCPLIIYIYRSFKSLRLPAAARIYILRTTNVIREGDHELEYSDLCFAS